MKTSNIIYGLGIIMVATMLMSCDSGIVGNGDVQTRTKKIDNFDRLEINGNFNVFLEQSGKAGLRIEADENVMDVIKVYESGDKLEIYSELNILRAKKKNLYISFDELEKLELTGAADFDLKGEAEEVELIISGAGVVKYKGHPEISRNVSGIGSLKRY